MPENIRYAELGVIEFDFAGEIFRIKEPIDVMLVGWPQASKWIMRNYGYILNYFKD